MNFVDLLMLGSLVVFAIVGWRQGFIAGSLSFLGFLGGGLMAVLWLPDLVERLVDSGTARVVLVALGVLVSAIAGQTLLSMLGRRLRSSMTWSPVRVVDNIGGAALNVLALVLVAWVIASIVNFLPRSEVTRQVNNSIVLTTMDSMLPNVARTAFSRLSDVVGTTAVPRVFSGLAPLPGPEVDAPPPEAASEAVKVIRDSTVRLTGSASRCNAIVSGSGFAVTSELVMTNAHVVAGVDQLMVRVRPGSASKRAEVVYFDPRSDIALVRLTGLVVPPVRLALGQMQPGQTGIVAGFPRGERFEAEPIRIRARVDARGRSIYGEFGVERDVYVMRGSVQQGNSGGPLVDDFGEVHGMVFATGLDERDTAYALSADEIRIALEQAGSAAEPVSTGSCELR